MKGTGETGVKGDETGNSCPPALTYGCGSAGSNELYPFCALNYQKYPLEPDIDY